jgi:hypothetical protein
VGSEMCIRDREKALFTAMTDLRAFNANEAIRYIVGEWLRTNGYLSWEE